MALAMQTMVLQYIAKTQDVQILKLEIQLYFQFSF